MRNNVFDLSGKVAVVTGGTGVLGAAMCHGLADAGASIVVIARDQAKIDHTVAALRESGAKAMGISADVLDQAALERAAQQVIDAHGKVDILVNGAGGNKPEATAVPGQRTFFDLLPDAMQGVFDLNYTSAVLASQVFGKLML